MKCSELKSTSVKVVSSDSICRSAPPVSPKSLLCPWSKVLSLSQPTAFASICLIPGSQDRNGCSIWLTTGNSLGRCSMSLPEFIAQSVYLEVKRDGVFTSSEMTPLPAKPFNHLSVLAYLAIGVVVFSSSLVAGYLVYSCYHSARRKGGRRTSLLNGSPTLVHGKFYDAELGVYKKTGNKSSKGAMANLRFGYNERISESKVYSRFILYFLLLTPSFQKSIIKASDTADSHTFFEDESHVYFDLDGQVSLPPLAHTSERKALYIPFHLPPPPSPSPAHKQHILRCGGGKIPDSPASPTPSFFPDISPSSVMLTYDQDGIQTEQRIRFDKCRNGGTKRSREQVPVIRPNSNNMRFIPPLDFYAAGSTVYLHREPKLSPVHSSVILPNPTRNDKLYSQTHCGMARPLQRSAMAVPMTVLSADKENCNPISSELYRKRRWDYSRTSPTLCVKPGPGYF